MSETKRTTRISRGTLTIDVDACKGCELCIVACPPRVLTMSTAVNEIGYRYPELHEGCTGCTACQMVCPDYVFDVYRYPRDPQDAEDPEDHDVPEATAQEHERQP